MIEYQNQWAKMVRQCPLERNSDVLKREITRITSVDKGLKRQFWQVDFSPMHKAIELENPAMVNALLKYDLSVNSEELSEDGKTSWPTLHRAIECDNIEAIKQLLKNKVDVGRNGSKYPHQNVSAVQLAKNLKRKEIVQILETYRGKNKHMCQ